MSDLDKLEAIREKVRVPMSADASAPLLDFTDLTMHEVALLAELQQKLADEETFTREELEALKAIEKKIHPIGDFEAELGRMRAELEATLSTRRQLERRARKPDSSPLTEADLPSCEQIGRLFMLHGLLRDLERMSSTPEQKEAIEACNLLFRKIMSTPVPLLTPKPPEPQAVEPDLAPAAPAKPVSLVQEVIQETLQRSGRKRTYDHNDRIYGWDFE